jgi:hypothetical protein
LSGFPTVGIKRKHDDIKVNSSFEVYIPCDIILSHMSEPKIDKQIIDLVNEPTLEPIDEPADKNILEPIVEPINEPADKNILEPIVEPINEQTIEPVKIVCTQEFPELEEYKENTAMIEKFFMSMFNDKPIVVWLDNDQAIGYPQGLSSIFPQLCSLFIKLNPRQPETETKLKCLTMRLLARFFMGTSYLRPGVLNMFEQLCVIKEFYKKLYIVMYTRASHGHKIHVKYSWLDLVRSAIEIAVFANKSKIKNLSIANLSTRDYDKIKAIQKKQSVKHNIYTHCISSYDIERHYSLSPHDNEYKNTQLAKKMCGIPDNAMGVFIDDKIHEIVSDVTLDLKAVLPYNCVPSKFEIVEKIVEEFKEEFNQLNSAVAFADILQIFRTEYEFDVKCQEVLKTDNYTVGSEVYDNLPKYLFELCK